MATVLIIDDSHLGRTHTSLALSAVDHTVLVARDGVEALALLASDSPDIVVVNQHTPAMRTEEIIDRVRAGRGLTRVIVRGTALTDATARAYRARGADAVLSGPHETEGPLIDAIETCCRGAKLPKAG